ncbi:YrzI family small protein [Lederbergia citri]|uniref:YrzI family small protein n=1 Tax=Lederbergia citri TaxID=2833580 RepID=A0A942TFK9_9BACI|nr:YrzI family small protein [Lederbergia citri]MBS4195307.1 YrzI family small protein [Lederbergia citri]
MTLNIIFFTITIKRRHISVQEALHHQKMEKMYDEIKDRQISMYRPY